MDDDFVEKKRAQNRASAARCRIKGIERLESLRERRQALLNQIKIEKDEQRQLKQRQDELMQLVNLDTVLESDAEMIKGLGVKQEGSAHSDVDTIPSTPS